MKWDFVFYFAVCGSVVVCSYENAGIVLLPGNFAASFDQSEGETSLGFRLICFTECL